MPKKNSPAEKTARKQQTAPAVQTEREKRAALVPDFKGGKISITPEQLDAMKDESYTPTSAIALSVLSTRQRRRTATRERWATPTKTRPCVCCWICNPRTQWSGCFVPAPLATDQAASLCMGIGVMTGNNPDAKRKYLSLACQFQGLQVRQIEALAKLRNGGRQHVTVEHVTVEAGGQAIVGNVTQGAGGGGAMADDYLERRIRLRK